MRKPCGHGDGSQQERVAGTPPQQAQSGQQWGSSGSPGCATSVGGRRGLPRWAGAGRSAPQDDPRPHRAEPSAWWVTAAVPQPKHPQPGNKVKGETCSKSTLFCSGRVSAPSSPLLSYLPPTCSPRPPSLPSLFRWFPRRRCFAPALLTSLLRKQSHTWRLEGPDPHGGLGGSPGLAPAALHRQHAASRTHPASLARSKRSWRGAGCAQPPLPVLLPPPPSPARVRAQPPPAEQGPGASCVPSWQEGQNT